MNKWEFDQPSDSHFVVEFTKPMNVELKPMNVELKPMNVELKPMNVEFKSPNVELEPTWTSEPELM